MIVDLHELPGTISRIRRLTKLFLDVNQEEGDPEEVSRVQRITGDLESRQIRQEDFDFITGWFTDWWFGLRPH